MDRHARHCMARRARSGPFDSPRGAGIRHRLPPTSVHKAIIAFALVAACGGPPAPRPAPRPVRSSEPAAPAPPPARPSAVLPDVPEGADAARDAQLASVAKGIAEAYPNSEGALSSDGKRLVFVSQRDDLAQLYVADPRRPGAAARAERRADHKLPVHRRRQGGHLPLGSSRQRGLLHLPRRSLWRRAGRADAGGGFAERQCVPSRPGRRGHHDLHRARGVGGGLEDFLLLGARAVDAKAALQR